MLKARIKDDFKNLLEYQEWVNHTFQNISPKNKGQLDRFEKHIIEDRIKNTPEWYGKNANYEDMHKGIVEYQNPSLLDKIYQQVNDKISAGVRDKIKARKIRYNPKGLGVFIFDRAAMEMYRLEELYSPSLDRVVEPEEVRKVKTGYELVKDGSAVFKRWEKKNDGKPKIRTINKNVYAYFPSVNKDKLAVELFISCGGHAGIKAEQFLYSGINAIIVAQLLEKARIQTRISIVIGSSPDDFREKVYAAIIPVKNYDENLDINLLALLTSDPRFFRYEGFKGVVSLYDHFNVVCPDNLGYGLTKNSLINTIEKSSYTNEAKLAPNRYYFGWTFSEEEAIDTINTTIDELAKRLNIQ